VIYKSANAARTALIDDPQRENERSAGANHDRNKAASADLKTAGGLCEPGSGAIPEPC